jgi:hypothetical protein
MSSAGSIPTDFAALIDSLDADAIRAQLEDLDRQERALRVLLRSAVARQRAQQRHRVAPEDPRGER